MGDAKHCREDRSKNLIRTEIQLPQQGTACKSLAPVITDEELKLSSIWPELSRVCTRYGLSEISEL
jgi:hypothetical protein